MAVDLIGTDQEADTLSLHIAAAGQDPPAALCGADASRNIISEALLPGLNVTLVCPACLAMAKGVAGSRVQ
jgi:hypothetical protein